MKISHALVYAIGSKNSRLQHLQYKINYSFLKPAAQSFYKR